MKLHGPIFVTICFSILTWVMRGAIENLVKHYYYEEESSPFELPFNHYTIGHLATVVRGRFSGAFLRALAWLLRKRYVMRVLTVLIPVTVALTSFDLCREDKSVVIRNAPDIVKIFFLCLGIYAGLTYEASRLFRDSFQISSRSESKNIDVEVTSMREREILVAETGSSIGRGQE